VAVDSVGGQVELRGQAPRTLVDVLDAVSAHRRMSRWDLITEILERWADDKMAETTAILRVTGCGKETER
jgi:hypothetical protein